MGLTAPTRRALRAEVAPTFFLKIHNPGNPSLRFLDAVKQFWACATAFLHGVEGIATGSEGDVLHHQAFDYVVKSETAFVRLRKIITTIFQYRKMEKELKWYMDRM